MALADYPMSVLRQKLIDLIQIAKASENQAISVPILLSSFIDYIYANDSNPFWTWAKQELLEIAMDENDHDAIYTDILSMITTGETANNTFYYHAD